MSEVRLGKKHSEATLAKIKVATAGRPGFLVEIKNVVTGETVEYGSVAKAAKALGCDRGVITRRSESGCLLKDVYLIKIKGGGNLSFIFLY